MTKDLEVRHCRVLLAVKDAGGVGAAARTLGVAQSTVSETLLSLERVLGAPVTTRRAGHGATLTAAAEALIPHARVLVAASETALAAIAHQSQGAIRLGTVESISSFLLPAPLGAFRSRWPQVSVRVAIGLCEDLRARVRRGELDAALTIEGGEGGDASSLPRAALQFIVAPGHQLACRVVSRADLAGLTFLLADHDGAFNALLKSWLAAAGQPPSLESAGSIDGVKRGVMNSNVIGVLPDYAVADEVAARSLVALDLHEPAPRISLRLTTLETPLAGTPLDGLIRLLATTATPSMR